MSGILANAAGGGGLLAGLFSGGAAPLVGIAGQFLQGIFNRNAANRERQQSIEDVRQQFVRLREAAELGGYNPLAVLGMGSGIPVSRSGAYMGSAIADSALMVADSMQRNGEASRASRVSALEMANADLQERLTRATLRPTVGGVFQRPAVLLHPMAGGGNVQAVSAASGGVSGGDARLGPEPISQSDQASGTPSRALKLWGIELPPTGDNSDAEAWATRYGEDFMSPSWFAGWGAFGQDLLLAADAKYRAVRRDQWRANPQQGGRVSAWPPQFGRNSPEMLRWEFRLPLDMRVARARAEYQRTRSAHWGRLDFYGPGAGDRR